LIDYFAIDSHTAWYRTRLLEIAVSHIGDYWLFGVGDAWPHHWAKLLDGREFIDVVNHFVIVTLYGGLFALFLYIYSHIATFRKANKFSLTVENDCQSKMIFGLLCGLLAVDFSSFSVGLFSSVLILSNILLGILVSVSSIKLDKIRNITKNGNISHSEN